ncbi:hypothetical protein SISSUDRAFT_1043223 [Sistotremastrum suecicum HHB10207 ss-3]|uniref:Proteasome subunit alpha type 1 n=1 Tax=Sistotremastrum suecicum HHB10207 ss-3 TaxID=1314776 RepID=A0A166FZ19_9AGAM|nr:hypothetical protein SISSUDRAFT_1043223 [Sistotremastrum suecicum HHB10207 ss-3]
MNTNPFNQPPRAQPYNTTQPLPPGQIPQQNSYDYSAYWASHQPQGAALGAQYHPTHVFPQPSQQPQPPPPPPPEQSALYANYGYGPHWQRQQQQQHQQQQQAQQQQQQAAFIASQPQPMMGHPTYNPYQAQVAQPPMYPGAQQTPFVQAPPQAFRPPPQPHFISIPQSAIHPPTQPMRHNTHQSPPAKRPRFDGPQHPPTQPRPQPPTGPAQQNNHAILRGGVNQMPLGGRGGAPMAPMAHRNGMGRGGTQMSAPGPMLGRGGMGVSRGRGGRGSGTFGQAGRGGGLGQSRLHGNRFGGGHNRRGGGGGAFGKRSGLSNRENKPENDRAKDSTASTAVKDGARKEENRRSLTDFKLIGLQIQELDWSWGICTPIPAEPSSSENGERSDDLTQVKEEDQEMDLDEKKILAPSSSVPPLASEPRSRVRVYFHFPEDHLAPASVPAAGSGLTRGKRKKTDDDDDDEVNERNIRPRQASAAPSVDMVSIDEQSAIAGTSDNGRDGTQETEDNDWLMAAIAEGSEGEKSELLVTEGELAAGLDNLDADSSMLLGQDASTSELQGAELVTSDEHDLVPSLFEPTVLDSSHSGEPPKEDSEPLLQVTEIEDNLEEGEILSLTGVRPEAEEDMIAETSTKSDEKTSTDEPLAAGLVGDSSEVSASLSLALPESHDSSEHAQMVTDEEGIDADNLPLLDNQVVLPDGDGESLIVSTNVGTLEGGSSRATTPPLYVSVAPDAALTKTLGVLDSPHESQPSSTLFGSSYSASEPAEAGSPSSKQDSNALNDAPKEPSEAGPTNSRPPPSANRLSITYGSSQRRLVIDATVVDRMKVFRKDGRFEVQMSISKDETGLKGILMEGCSSENPINRPMDLTTESEEDPLNPPFFKTDLPAKVTLTIFLDKYKPLSEPGWCKSGNVEEWLRKEFGNATDEDGWENRIEVVDPETPFSIIGLIENWSQRSSAGAPDERERFRKTFMVEPENILNILLRMVRGDRSSPMPLGRNAFTGPLLEAFDPGSPFASQHTHTTLAMLSLVNMATEFAGQSKNGALVHEKIAEIVRHFPTQQVHKALDSSFRDWKASKRGK